MGLWGMGVRSGVDLGFCIVTVFWELFFHHLLYLLWAYLVNALWFSHSNGLNASISGLRYLYIWVLQPGYGTIQSIRRRPWIKCKFLSGLDKTSSVGCSRNMASEQIAADNHSSFTQYSQWLAFPSLEWTPSENVLSGGVNGENLYIWRKHADTNAHCFRKATFLSCSQIWVST